MHEFDRVLQRDDVDRLGLVDLVQHRGQRGGLAGAGRAGDQHQPGFFARHLAEDLRELAGHSSVGITVFSLRSTME